MGAGFCHTLVAYYWVSLSTNRFGVDRYRPDRRRDHVRLPTPCGVWRDAFQAPWRRRWGRDPPEAARWLVFHDLTLCPGEADRGPYSQRIPDSGALASISSVPCPGVKNLPAAILVLGQSRA